MSGRARPRSRAAATEGSDDKDFYKDKLVTARFFIERILPEAATHLARIEAGADTVMGLSADSF